MSVETLEAPVVEALSSVEASVKSARCATLAGAALACAGCWLVETCKKKAEVEQGSNDENEAEKPFADELINFVEIDSLFPELDLMQSLAAKQEVVEPEKTITPLPYEVKNTTPNYIDMLMDDKVEIVLARSITHPSKPARAEILAKALTKPAYPEVENVVHEPETTIEPALDVAEAFTAIETLILEPVADALVDEPLELAPSEEIIVDTSAQSEPEIIVVTNKPLAQAEAKVTEPEILTNNILRPIAEVVVNNVIKVAENIREVKPKPKTTISKIADSPIFYNSGPKEIITENVAPIDIIIEVKPELEMAVNAEPTTFEIIETKEALIEAEDVVEETEAIQEQVTVLLEEGAEYIEQVDEAQPESASRLYEALLSGDDTVDPESRLLVKKIVNRLKILRQLALRALRFSL